VHSHIGKRIIEGGLNVVSQQIRAEWCCCRRRLRHRSLNVTRAGGSHRPTILFARLLLIPDARFATAEGIIMYLDGRCCSPLLMLTTLCIYEVIKFEVEARLGGHVVLRGGCEICSLTFSIARDSALHRRRAMESRSFNINITHANTASPFFRRHRSTPFVLMICCPRNVTQPEQ
jgi:hypothetical protein